MCLTIATLTLYMTGIELKQQWSNFEERYYDIGLVSPFVCPFLPYMFKRLKGYSFIDVRRNVVDLAMKTKDDEDEVATTHLNSPLVDHLYART